MRSLKCVLDDIHGTQRRRNIILSLENVDIATAATNKATLNVFPHCPFLHRASITTTVFLRRENHYHLNLFSRAHFSSPFVFLFYAVNSERNLLFCTLVERILTVAITANVFCKHNICTCAWLTSKTTQ